MECRSPIVTRKFVAILILLLPPLRDPVYSSSAPSLRATGITARASCRRKRGSSQVRADRSVLLLPGRRTPLAPRVLRRRRPGKVIVRACIKRKSPCDRQNLH
ncbi:hypothetical protein PVAP13_3NG015400 [Panicum virgatum]|uniref:Secreted protein n=1 Tax=Panicum virgatum TaxID=38727 RepID=A0A8T0U1G8_PANVG|nr:hypothetical protein PVAP13_3NG015400 [Panicum virgatum]